jgi:hypothetical protein
VFSSPGWWRLWRSRITVACDLISRIAAVIFPLNSEKGLDVVNPCTHHSRVKDWSGHSRRDGRCNGQLCHESLHGRLPSTASSLMADDSDSEDDAQTGTENEGGPNIISHQGAVFMMDTAIRFVQTQPLVDAAVRGDIPGLQSLLQQPGINVNVRNGLEETALFAAVCNDHLEAARLLLDAGADPDLKCFNEWAALHAVSRSGNEAMASLLLEKNADNRGPGRRRLGPAPCGLPLRQQRRGDHPAGRRRGSQRASVG